MPINTSQTSGTARLVFIVGMPRSGTKLLRDLLNGHSQIAIFPNESHFIPYFYRRYGTRTDLNDKAVFARFFREFSNTTFSRRMALRGLAFDEHGWRTRLSGGRYADLLAGLFSYYRERSGASIVGDKTPEYLTQVPLLGALFPEARFIHIVRDPRDYALSIRNAWQKSMLRAVQRWKNHIRKFRDDVDSCNVRQVTVHYEDLIATPEKVLSHLCDFLGLQFEQQMTSLRAAPEELGDARGLRTVLSNNAQKWISRMTAAELREIESVAGDLMASLGYAPVTVRGDRDLNAVETFMYRAADALHLFRFRLRTEGGLLGALGETWRAHRHSGVDE